MLHTNALRIVEYKFQSDVAQSTAEVEFIAVIFCAGDFFVQVKSELGYMQIYPTVPAPDIRRQ